MPERISKQLTIFITRETKLKNQDRTLLVAKPNPSGRPWSRQMCVRAESFHSAIFELYIYISRKRLFLYEPAEHNFRNDGHPSVRAWLHFNWSFSSRISRNWSISREFRRLPGRVKLGRRAYCFLSRWDVFIYLFIFLRKSRNEEVSGKRRKLCLDAEFEISKFDLDLNRQVKCSVTKDGY